MIKINLHIFKTKRFAHYFVVFLIIFLVAFTLSIILPLSLKPSDDRRYIYDSTQLSKMINSNNNYENIIKISTPQNVETKNIKRVFCEIGSIKINPGVFYPFDSLTETPIIGDDMLVINNVLFDPITIFVLPNQDFVWNNGTYFYRYSFYLGNVATLIKRDGTKEAIDFSIENIEFRVQGSKMSNYSISAFVHINFFNASIVSENINKWVSLHNNIYEPLTFNLKNNVNMSFY